MEGLKDRSSHRLYRPTRQAIIEQVEALRRQRWTGKAIAAVVGVSPATVSRILQRLGLKSDRFVGARPNRSAVRSASVLVS
ncbi:MAG: hypothetical protein E5V18_00475 [Mesorhizobium sp.]|nr:MAG: hypothetical protein EOS51_24115 [Mesorhizobium sp.]TGT95192.1 hypothetical protein EN807_17580 [Mesorhizobium sp. M5C.F.Ca.ET.164.01.1.1]RWD47926.1 MAG: hypothetical protein EOS35_03100 [Mesorhizobium sp.]TIS39657.1 MAG: hypothetical protein E5W95_14180 [Mesorhizobium sp.]TIU27982.1 MAG: hypothetical protein E5W53_00780 [Mesorhizobium sp.]